MNSRQRRHRRVFEHEVKIVCGNHERYFQFDHRIEQAKGWLQWTAKKKHWHMEYTRHDVATFRFSRGDLATIFALKWA